MANGQDYLNELREKVNQLQDEVDGKDLQLLVIQNDLVDVNKPSMAIFKSLMVLMEMQLEIVGYAAKNGWTAKAKASMERLNGLVDLNRSLDMVADSNYKLKNMNSMLHTNYQLLRIENKELKQQLQAVKEAEDWK